MYKHWLWKMQINVITADADTNFILVMQKAMCCRLAKNSDIQFLVSTQLCLRTYIQRDFHLSHLHLIVNL